MNITMLRLKPVVKELRAIHDQLERIADCMEVELAQTGINMKVPKADASGSEPSVDYVDEEMEWAREEMAYLKRQDKLKDDEESG